jgi:polyphosphate kinase
MRKQLDLFIDREIRNAKKGLPAGILLKLNSLSDGDLVEKLNEAANKGVEVKLIIRGIYTMRKVVKKKDKSPQATSIVDRFLEHARVMVFHNNGKRDTYISSADWMVRNLDHRVEAACPIIDEKLKKELIGILGIQLQDNVKARVLDRDFTNNYVNLPGKKIRSQAEIYGQLSKLKTTFS